jgi:hypothetical protein
MTIIRHPDQEGKKLPIEGGPSQKKSSVTTRVPAYRVPPSTQPVNYGPYPGDEDYVGEEDWTEEEKWYEEEFMAWKREQGQSRPQPVSRPTIQQSSPRPHHHPTPAVSIDMEEGPVLTGPLWVIVTVLALIFLGGLFLFVSRGETSRLPENTQGVYSYQAPSTVQTTYQAEVCGTAAVWSAPSNQSTFLYSIPPTNLVTVYEEYGRGWVRITSAALQPEYIDSSSLCP